MSWSWYMVRWGSWSGLREGLKEGTKMPLWGRSHASKGTDPWYFICFGPSWFTAQQFGEQQLKDGKFSPEHLAESLCLSPFRSSCCLSFPLKVKSLFFAAQECNNAGFFWSGYCVCLSGFKLLPERHFRGHHSVVSKRQPDVDFVPRGSAFFFPSSLHFYSSETSTTYLA